MCTQPPSYDMKKSELLSQRMSLIKFPVTLHTMNDTRYVINLLKTSAIEHGLIKLKVEILKKKEIFIILL